MATRQERKGNKITDEIKRKRDTTVNLWKGNPELTAKSQKIIDSLKAKQDLIIKGQRIKPYRFNLTGKDAKKAAMFRKVKKALEKKKRERLSAIPGPGYPPPPQIAPHLFLPAKKGRTKKKQFSQQLIFEREGGRRTRRKRRNRKRKTKKKRKRIRTKKKRRKRRRKTRR